MSLAEAVPLRHHLDACCRRSPLEDLAPVQLGEVGVGAPSVFEPLSRRLSGVVSESDGGDVQWVLWELQPVVAA